MCIWEHFCTSAVISQLRNYRTITHILAVIGIGFNAIRILIITTSISLAIISGMGNTPDGSINWDCNVIFGSLSIFLGVSSFGAEIVLLRSMNWNSHRGIQSWLAISALIFTCSVVCLGISAAQLGVHSISLSFLLDSVRIPLQMYLVHNSLPLQKICTNGTDATTFNVAYNHMNPSMTGPL